MPDHDWGRRSDNGKFIEGPCIWCGVEPYPASEPCPKHPRSKIPRMIPKSIVDIPHGARIAEIQAEENRLLR